MRNLRRRLDKLEEIMGVVGCVCDEHGELELVVVEPGSSQDQVRALEDEKAFTCPVHGQRLPPILHLSPSDVYG